MSFGGLLNMISMNTKTFQKAFYLYNHISLARLSLSFKWFQVLQNFKHVWQTLQPFGFGEALPQIVFQKEMH